MLPLRKQTTNKTLRDRKFVWEVFKLAYWRRQLQVAGSLGTGEFHRAACALSHQTPRRAAELAFLPRADKESRCEVELIGKSQ